MSAEFSKAVLAVLGEDPQEPTDEAHEVCDRALIHRAEYGISEDMARPGNETFEEYVRAMQAEVRAAVL